MSTSEREYLFPMSVRLREERVRLGYSQEKFGELIGTSDRTIKKYEGNETSPKADHLLAMDQAGANILYIVTGRRSTLDVRQEMVGYITPARQAAAEIADLPLSEGDADLILATARRLAEIERKS